MRDYRAGSGIINITNIYVERKISKACGLITVMIQLYSREI